MYRHEEEIDIAIEVFTQTIQWCQNHWPKSPAHLSLIKEAANFKLKYKQKKEAINFYTLAQLISAYSLVDPEKDRALCEHLSLSESMSLKVDVKALENSPGATYIWKKGGKVTGDDPERWLPMQEHSYYEGRKKGKNKDQIGKGTQGATAGTSSELDARKTVSSPPTSPRPGSVATLSASTSNIILPRHRNLQGLQQQKRNSNRKRRKVEKVAGWLR
uniref:Signal recognition particle subunit SRP72 n=1 Tax=Theropithecus gelada TaxID=9565 RepID=A0A8D2G7M3_THEGE